MRSHRTQNRKTKACPECGSAELLAVVHGIPTGAQAKAIKAGKAMLADREEWEGMNEWHCQSCGCEWSRHSRRFKKPGSSVNATQG